MVVRSQADIIQYMIMIPKRLEIRNTVLVEEDTGNTFTVIEVYLVNIQTQFTLFKLTMH
jgi:hypothetical protein